MRFAFLLSFHLIAAALRADVTALRVVQSGDPFGSMVMHDRGINGQGEIIAIVDEGADLLSCAFAEEDGSLPPFNTVTAEGDLASGGVDRSRRKVIAYDLLFSCDQYPLALYGGECDEPGDPRVWSSSRGTEIASIAAGDRSPFWTSGEGDGVAPGAKLVIQDTGYRPNRLPLECTLPGLCLLSDLTPVLAQAYRQGARIQSHQWTERVLPDDRSEFSRQLDAFVASHPDLVLVFEAGDAGDAGPGSVAGPGTAKNVVQVGGTRQMNFDDSVVWQKSGRGAAPYGRIKPDLVAPSVVFASTAATGGGPSCDGTYTAGTALAAPLIAGAAALVRQYYRDGFYPSGAARMGDGLEPSAALVKATLIAAARAVPHLTRNGRRVEAGPVPSFDQGFGMPVLGDVLSLDPRGPRIRAVDRAEGLADGETYELVVRTGREGRLSATLVWTDPPSAQLVHDLDLEMIGPSGARAVGNAPLTGGTFDRANNVEKAEIENAAAGEWRVRVHGFRVGSGERQPFALVIAGEIEPDPARRRVVRR